MEPSQHILLVEDDLKLASLVREYLEKNEYRVSSVVRGDHAIAAVQDTRPDLVILDVMLPGLDGIEVCKQLRPDFRGAILMLTARGEDMDEVLGLEVGADDYLAKPVRPRVLLARVRALLRRMQVSESRSVIAVEELVIDSGNRSVTRSGSPIDLTTAEFDLLWELASAAGRPRSRDELSIATRGIPYDGQDRTIDLRVATLRTKLGDTSRPPRIILSIRGVGYQLAAATC